MNAPLFRLSKGDAVVIDGVWHEQVHRTKDTMTLLPIGGTTPRPYSSNELLDLYFDPGKRLKIVRRHAALLDPALSEVVAQPLDSFSPEQQAEMLRRLDYVRACDHFFIKRDFIKRPEREHPRGYARIARIVWRYRCMLRKKFGSASASETDEPVSGSTLRDWYGRWLKCGREYGALAPLTHKRGKSGQRIEPAVNTIIADAIREKWLTLEAPALTVVYDHICRQIEVANEGRPTSLETPCEMTVRRWIKDNIDPYTETFFRKGKKEADHQYRLIHKAPVAARPLQIVEFDDTPLDIIIIDDRGNPRGRANLTAGICTATGMLAGWHIGWEKPSWATVMQALRMAVSKKDTSESGALNPYPVYGVPEMIKVDNGAAYRSTSLMAAAGALQFELRFVPVGKPNLKGKVERFFREVATDFASVLPGKTFSNIRQRGDYDSEGYACFTLKEVQDIFMRWVVDIYHGRPSSRSFNQTPLQRWSHLAGAGVRLPPESEDLAPLIGLVVERTIQADGITFMGLTYRHPRLADMRKESPRGQKWMIRVDPLDISSMMILDADAKKWIVIPCQQPHLIHGLTLKMWTDVVSAARAVTKAGQYVTRKNLLKAREDLISFAASKGNRPRGKINLDAKDYRWLEKNLDNKEFEICMDPNDLEEGGRSAAQKAERRLPKTVASAAPASTAPASEAGGHPVVQQPDPDAETVEAGADMSHEIGEVSEQDRHANFVAETARAIDNKQSVHHNSAPPLVPANEDGSTDDPPLEDMPAEPEEAFGRPIDLVDENDIEHFGNQQEG